MVLTTPLKKYIVQTFIKCSTQPIPALTTRISKYLSCNYINDEIVFYEKKKCNVKIIKSIEDSYVVSFKCDTTDDDIREINRDIDRDICRDICETVRGNELDRTFSIGKNDIASFLNQITEDTPFGKILRQNVWNDLRSEENSFVNDNYDDIVLKKHRTSENKVYADITRMSGIGKLGMKDISIDSRLTENRMQMEKFYGKLIKTSGFSEKYLYIFLEVFLFLSNNNEYLSFEGIEIEDFLDELKKKDNECKFIILIVNRIMKKISEHFRFAREKEIKEMFYNAIEENNLVIEKEFSANYTEKENANFKNLFLANNKNENEIIWNNIEVTKSNWIQIVKNFLFDCYNTYQIEGFFKFGRICKKNTELGNEDKLFILKFLIDVVTKTFTFKEFIGESIEARKMKEKTLFDIKSHIRRRTIESKDKLGDELENYRIDIRKLERDAFEIEMYLVRKRAKVCIGKHDGTSFYFANDNVYFVKENNLYFLEDIHFESLIKSIRNKSTARDATFLLGNLRGIKTFLRE